MRRAPIVIGATAAGLAGVLSFHSKSGSFSALPAGTQAAGGASSAAGGGAATSGSAANGSGASSTTASSGTTHHAASSSGTPASSGAAAPGSSSSASSSASPASSGGNGSSSGAGSSSASGSTAPAAPKKVTLTGKVVQFGYGQLSVKVTLVGKKITAVGLATLQVAEPTSQYINQQAVPYLQQEVMHAQSANIQGVSGATYSAEAFAMSLQSALSKAPKG